MTAINQSCSHLNHIQKYRLQSQVEVPLGVHPCHTRARDHQRAQEPSLGSRRAKHLPLAHEMRQRDAIRSNSKIVNVCLVNVVCAKHPDDRGQKGPCSEEARGVWGDPYGRVELAGVGGGREGLEGVEGGHNGDLCYSVRMGIIDWLGMWKNRTKKSHLGRMPSCCGRYWRYWWMVSIMCELDCTNRGLKANNVK